MLVIDPNGPPLEEGIFGLPYTEGDAAVIFLPVPWEATTSYGRGTAAGPRAILAASHQLDLYDADVEKPYQAGMHVLEESKMLREKNQQASQHARKVVQALNQGQAPKAADLKTVNEACGWMNSFVQDETERLLSADKIIGIIGGDHSVPLGAFRALGKHEKSFGILHIDAHFDLRRAYQGFEYSHASIMYNALETVPQIEKIVQVGIRDYCEEELDYARKKSVHTFFDSHLQRQKLEGRSWAQLTQPIVETLPGKLWVSFDVDGLDPRFCPHTGTPVPGGLDFSEAIFVLREVVKSGRKIIGFDLNEVAPGRNDEWDANVGMRLLYKLTAFTLASRGRAKLLP